MLRITRIEDIPERASFKVEGRLVSVWARLVEQECRQAFQGDRQVVLDLTHVTFADEGGIQVLRVLAQDPRIVLLASEFIKQLLGPQRSFP